MIELSRRGFLKACLVACAAPAIVRVDSLMKLVPLVQDSGILTESSLEQALIDMMNATEDRGLRIMLQPTAILVSRENYKSVKRFMAKYNNPDPLSSINLEVKEAPFISPKCGYLVSENNPGLGTVRMSDEPVPRGNGEMSKAPINIHGEIAFDD